MKAEGVVLVAICDADRRVAQLLASRYGVASTYAEPNELLTDDSIEAVLIALPDALHVSVTIDALAHGKHVLVEKPLGITVAECRRVVAEVRRSGLKLQVGAMKRHDPGVEFARQFVAERLGQVLSFNAWYDVSAFRDQFQATLSPPLLDQTGAALRQESHKVDRERYYLTTHGAHLFDSLRFILGQPSHVTARLVHLNGNYSWHGLVELADGGLGHFELTVSVNSDWHEGFAVFGENGSVEIETFFPFYLRSSDVKGFDAQQSVWLRPLFPDSNPYKRQLERFAAAVASNGPTSPDSADGLAAVELIEAVARSVATESRVAVEL